MSKSFPGSPRKYDLYIGTQGRLEVGRVLFNPHGRFVIREAYSREDWEKERSLDAVEGPPPPNRLLGIFSCDDKPLAPEHRSVTPSDVPADFSFFYGADYV